MKTAFAYIRVSTTKQGSDGASLPEQRDSIERFASRNNLHILRWFEEQETAAKTGRPKFREMISLAKKGKAQALLFHKIDRSTRNLFEWAEVSSLPEQGIEVHYSHEPVDLSSSHGRTAADVAAVFAAAFIRNLREETKKGMRGRLKQGLYPFGAPLGYVDNGRAQVKTLDPVKAPLVRKLFERYATGEYGLLELVDYAQRIGLTNKASKRLTLNGVATILHNRFYLGLMVLRGTGEVFSGLHEPLVGQDLFTDVQDILAGRVPRRKPMSSHLFSRLITCERCRRVLIGERQRGYTYYRCHECKGNCIREDEIRRQLENDLRTLNFGQFDLASLKDAILKELSSITLASNDFAKGVSLELGKLTEKLDKATDAFLEGHLSSEDYNRRKLSLLERRIKLQEQLDVSKQSREDLNVQAQKILEHLKCLHSKVFLEDGGESRRILKCLTSNISVFQKNLTLQWVSPYKEMVLVGGLPSGDPHRDHLRSRPKWTKAKLRKIAEIIVCRLSGRSIPRTQIEND